MFSSRLVHVGLGAGVLLAGLASAGSVFAQEAAKGQALANLPSAPVESTSRPQNKAKKGLATLKPTAPAAGSVADFDKDTYRIGVDDQLQISVWHEPELATTAQVRPDGKITLPLLNDISVMGLKTDELQLLLIEKLKPFLNEPQVTVTVQQIRSRKVSVFGQVGHQGNFPLNGKETVLEVLAQAGGLAPFAKTKAIYILRTVNGERVRIPFRYKDAITGRGDNPVLLPGDMVVVP